MRQSEFGSFSPSFVGVHVRFDNPNLFQHFADLWRNPGTRGRLPNAGAASKFAYMSAGTTFEHELRHFHDFLWSDNSLQIFWLRIQSLMNSMSMLKPILDSSDFDTLPVPIPSWLAMPAQDRCAFESYIRAWPELSGAKLWAPPYIDAESYQVGQGSKPKPEGDAGFKQLSQIVTAQYARIRKLREGYYPQVDGEPRVSPRFAFELSALLTQLASVYRTYGQQESIDFVNFLATQRNPVIQTFLLVLAIMSGHRPADIMKGPPSIILAETVDWRAVRAASFWSLAGSYKLDGELGCPGVRLAALIEGVATDPNRFLPPWATSADLMNLWSGMFDVARPLDAVTASRASLEKHLGAVHASLKLHGGLNEPTQQTLGVVESVLAANADMLQIFRSDIDSYVVPERYNAELYVWPGGPTYIDIRRTNYEFGEINPLAIRPVSGSIKNPKQTTAVPTLSNPHSHFVLEDTLALRQKFVALDALFDHHQIDAIDEEAAKRVIEKEHGKKLVFLQ